MAGEFACGCGLEYFLRVGVVETMRIDIWSDVVCPFCYIGKRHLEAALADFEHSSTVEVVWHSFELDPTIPAEPTGSLSEVVAKKYNMTPEQADASQEDIASRAAQVGLEFNWRNAKFGNTFNAHRLIHLAAAHGKQDQAEEALFRAYFTEEKNPAHREVLAEVAAKLELPADEVAEVLDGDRYADEVRADETQAHQTGITGVPFFVFDNKYAINGAQPTEVFASALERVWEENYAQPTQPNFISLKDNSATEGGCCGPNGCA